MKRNPKSELFLKRRSSSGSVLRVPIQNPIFVLMKLVYDASQKVFSNALNLIKGFSPKLTQLVEGRDGVFDRLRRFRDSNNKKIAWFHVASLGEYEQARPVISEFKNTFPDYGIVVSFFSPSGYDHVAKKPQKQLDFITYLPFDTAANAKRFIQILAPSVGFFVKYDLWPNHILEAKKIDIPLFLFSATFRKDQPYFKKYGGFFKRTLFKLDAIFCQNEESYTLVESLGYPHARVIGDTRYDRVSETADNPTRFEELAFFDNGKPVIVVGSAWQEDMEILIPYINESEYCWIIAPHDIDVQKMEGWQKQIKKSSLLYSGWDKHQEEEILFIDNVGMLSSLYQFANIAYVGGAFGKGLHNILEPLAYKIPVLFGKVAKPHKFPEAVQSVNAGCGFEIPNFEGLKKTFDYLSDGKNYQKACENARQLVDKNKGSAHKIVSAVKENLSK